MIDAQDKVFIFNGVSVGKITGFNIVDGITPDVKHSALSKIENEYLPGVPEYGLITIKIYRDFSDAGQAEMENCRSAQIVAPCEWQLPTGQRIVFNGYVKKLPIVGNDNGLGTADAVIKIASKITLAST